MISSRRFTVLPIFTAPTITEHHRTLLATNETWREVIPKVDQTLRRLIEQQLHRNKGQKMIRIDLSVEHATTILEAAK